MFQRFRKKNLTNDSESFVSNTNKKILIVEDNELNITLFSNLLDAHGYETRTVSEGEKVISLAHEFHPDLILMDIQLPDVSGLEVTKWIREDAALYSIPIIAVSAFIMKDDEKRILDSGCQSYIIKPIQITLFLETIRKILAGNIDAPPKRRVARKRVSKPRVSNPQNFAIKRKHKLDEEQLLRVRELWLSGMTAQEISETTGWLNRMGIIREVYIMDIDGRRKSSES